MLKGDIRNQSPFLNAQFSRGMQVLMPPCHGCFRECALTANTECGRPQARIKLF
jgi:hypothetical protein